MRDDYPEFQTVGTRIAVIVTDDLADVQAHWQENQLPFIGVADPEEIISTPYGQQWKLFKLGRMPAQLVVDCAGWIAFAHYAAGMSDIPKNEQMLKILGALPGCSED